MRALPPHSFLTYSFRIVHRRLGAHFELHRRTVGETGASEKLTLVPDHRVRGSHRPLGGTKGITDMTSTARLAPDRTRTDPLAADVRRSENDPLETVWRPSLRPMGPSGLDGDRPVRPAHGRRWIAGPL
jgi:hypothetical protein